METSNLSRQLTRFGPYLSLLAVIVAVLVFLPDDDGSGDVAAGIETSGFDTDGGDGSASGGGSIFDDAGSASGSGIEASDLTKGSAVSGGQSSGGSSSTPRSTVASGASSAAGSSSSGLAATPAGGQQSTQKPAVVSGPVANCDPATGRIAIPSTGAPACVKAFSGNNGGATYQGVTADTIKVVVFRPQANPAASAILSAAGASDSEEDTRTQFQEWADYYEANYETYGRKVELVFVDASGPPDDDAAGRADAIDVATKIKAFASFSAANNAYIDELAARGVMCFVCAIQQPNEYYESRAPFNWSTLMSSTQLYTHTAEYMGKRLAGKPAQFAGDPLIAQKERAFGLIWYETDSGAYADGTRFFIKELKKYGITLATEAQFKGYPDLAANQEQARPVIQKMKAAGATSLIMAADPFAPIFFTQEASRQQYFPEWIITGSALTDTSFFARTYDQTQWANAFGLGNLAGRLPEKLSDSFRLLNWFYGRGPTAEAGYGVIRSPIGLFFTGVHYAGAKLDPGTFRNGMFNAPPSNVGGITTVQSSFGVDLWGYPDYNAFDSMAEIWWDPRAQGEDEIGADGLGLYRFVDGGRRYLPGEHPSTPTKAFQPEGTVTVYQDYPDGDRPPDYPPPAR